MRLQGRVAAVTGAAHRPEGPNLTMELPVFSGQGIPPKDAKEEGKFLGQERVMTLQRFELPQIPERPGRVEEKE